MATQNASSGGQGRQNQSPWLFLDAAQVIFNAAKSRAYSGSANKDNTDTGGGSVPPGLVPVLEEQPKWKELSGLLAEIERESLRAPSPFAGDSYGTVLVMCSDAKECRQLREYLQTADRPRDDAVGDGEGEGGELLGDWADGPRHSASYMMRRKLRGYLAWKRDLSRFKAALSEMTKPGGGVSTTQIQKRQQESSRGRPPPNKRRRTRGGASVAGPSRAAGDSVHVPEDQAAQVAQLLQTLQPTEVEQSMKQEIAVDPFENMEDFYELFEMKDLVIVHAFKGDIDERLLEELRPRHIIMYNPDTAFVRRVEVGFLFAGGAFRPGC